VYTLTNSASLIARAHMHCTC